MSRAQEFLARFGYEVATRLSAIGQMRLWNVDKVSDTAVKLSGPDGMQIVLWSGTINFDLEDGREDQIKFEVSGEFPPDTFIMPEDKPKIGVGAKKGPKAVAADIERRFLSEYVPLYYEKLEIQQKIERDRDARERVMATLREAFDFEEVRGPDGHLERLEKRRTWSDAKCTWNEGDTYRGKLSASYAKHNQRWEVGLKLESLTVDQALRIAEVLREPRFPTEQLPLL